MKKLLLIALLIVGCGIFEKDEETNNSIVGVWEWIEDEVISGNKTTFTYPNDDNQETYIYNADGTYSYTNLMNGNESSGNGTYSVNSETITEVENDNTGVYDYEISSNVLTINKTSETSEYQHYYRYKRK